MTRSLMLLAILFAGGLALRAAPALPAELTPREQAVAIEKVDVVARESADIERLAGGLRFPWSLAFTPDGDILITEKYAGVRVMRAGRLLPNVLAGGPPNVLAKADSGVLDIVLDPEFATNQLVYLSLPRATKPRTGRRSGRPATTGKS